MQQIDKSHTILDLIQNAKIDLTRQLFRNVELSKHTIQCIALNVHNDQKTQLIHNINHNIG